MIRNKVKIIKSKQIIDERGKILLFHRNNYVFKHQYAEIYCSKIKLNQIKAWRMHKKFLFTYISLWKVRLVYCPMNGKEKNIKEIILSNEENYIIQIHQNFGMDLNALVIVIH